MDTFLTSVEKDLFQNTKVEKAKGNLTYGKKSINKLEKSDTIMKLQDEGNIFFIVDKNTDRLKAQQQLGRR